VRGGGLGLTTVVGLVVVALAHTSCGLGRRQGEEHEPLLAVAAADDELADAAPPRHGPAPPPPPRGAGGRPQAVALRRRAVQPASFLGRRAGADRGVVARARLLQKQPPQLPPHPRWRGGMMMVSGLLRRRRAGGVAEEHRVGEEGPDAAVREQLVGRRGGGVPTDEGELELQLFPLAVVGLLVSVIVVRRGLLWLRLAGVLLGGAGAFLLVWLQGGSPLHFWGDVHKKKQPRRRFIKVGVAGKGRRTNAKRCSHFLPTVDRCGRVSSRGGTGTRTRRVVTIAPGPAGGAQTKPGGLC
jgi:hypothetical protein